MLVCFHPFVIDLLPCWPYVFLFCVWTCHACMRPWPLRRPNKHDLELKLKIHLWTILVMWEVICLIKHFYTLFRLFNCLALKAPITYNLCQPRAWCITANNNPDNKVHRANMGPTWVLSSPGGPHVPCYQGSDVAQRSLLGLISWYHFNLLKSMQRN